MKTLLILLAVVSLSAAYDEGAPEAACKTMDPSAGHNTKPQNTTAPFQTVPLQLTILEGGYVKIVLQALNSTTFKGFMTMAFAADNPKKPIGTFELLDSIQTQTISCPVEGGKADEGVNNAITQTSDNYKPNITAMWKAPESFLGTVIFKTTFVQKKISYWVKVPSVANVTVGHCSGAATVASNIVVWFAAILLPATTLRFIN